MPIGHLKLNNPKADPNPNITFIRALPGLPNEDQALKILEAVAAQFRPITKQWGFGINSLVEYEWNREFAGRNWNAGEVVELVLRRQDGSFAPYTFILYVMAHELAHVKEMNHSRSFQTVNSKIRQELQTLRSRGYFGDGFWSSGRSLNYSSNEQPFLPEEEIENICGGTLVKRRRPKRKPTRDPNGNKPISSRRPRGEAPSKLGHTGRQTSIPRKAGGRNTRAGAFLGGGSVLDEAPEKTTFRKQANSKSAVAARLLAIEARLKAATAAAASSVKAEGSSSHSPLLLPSSGSSQALRQSELKFKAEEPKPAGDNKEAVDIKSDSEEEEEEYEDIEWVTENVPPLEFTQEEKEWMKNDMAHWRDDAVVTGKEGEQTQNSAGEDRHQHKWDDSDIICVSP